MWSLRHSTGGIALKFRKMRPAGMYILLDFSGPRFILPTKNGPKLIGKWMNMRCWHQEWLARRATKNGSDGTNITLALVEWGLSVADREGCIGLDRYKRARKLIHSVSRNARSIINGYERGETAGRFQAILGDDANPTQEVSP